MSTTAPDLPDAPTDAAAPPPVLQQLVGTFVSGMTALAIDVGARCGLFGAAAGAGPLTSAQLAERAGCDERYVREWLASMVTAGLLTYEPADRTYVLPDEHAPFLAGGGAQDLTPYIQMVTLAARYVEPVARCTRDGGGVPYEEFRPDFTGLMDALGRGIYDASLVPDLLPTAGLVPLLEAGARVADIGCGTGHSTNLMAKAFPASTFVGIDFAADAIDRARAEARDMGLGNVTFEVADILSAPTDPRYGLICAFDCIHDQADPAGVLAWVERALEPDGAFLMVDIAASSDLEDNLDHPFAPALYAGSLLHCMTVSLAQGGAGLGNMWGERVARTMLAEAGLGDVAIHHVEADPMDAVYVARRP